MMVVLSLHCLFGDENCYATSTNSYSNELLRTKISSKSLLLPYKVSQYIFDAQKLSVFAV